MDLSSLPESLRLLVLNQVAAPAVVADASSLLPPFDFAAERVAASLVLQESELDDLASKGVAVRDGVLGSGEMVAAALEELRRLREDGVMKQAGMTTEREGKWVNNQVRGDLHAWLHEGQVSTPGLAALLGRLQEVRTDLERVYGVQFGSTQLQATCYPGNGARYARHLDASTGNAPSRLLTLVWYAAPCACGELRLFLRDGTQRDVAPAADRLVVFQSRLLEHAVLPCNSDRFAVSVWLCE